MLIRSIQLEKWAHNLYNDHDSDKDLELEKTMTYPKEYCQNWPHLVDQEGRVSSSDL